MENKRDVMSLFDGNSVVNICAPMVRYSKLEFRSLVRKYGCELCFTPMIIAESFIESEKARQNEFKTNKEDRPLIAQFAARTVDEFVSASELVAPYCDGVDLNCGCPQRWAMKDGYGAELLSHAEKVSDMVHQLRNRIPGPFTVSVKMRIKEDLNTSVEFCRRMEMAGASFISVHGRTPKQRNEPVNIEAIRTIVDSINIPVIANGDIKSLSDAEKIYEGTGCKGAMAARGMLQNPAMFSGAPTTPLPCIQDWVDTCIQSGTHFQCFHHHLVFMLEKTLPKAKRRVFNALTNISHVTDYLVDQLNMKSPDRTKLKSLHSEIMFKDPCLDDGSFFKARTLHTNIEDYMEDIGIFAL